MADSTQQPDYYLHLDLAGAEMEPQPHTDGGETFLDFSESGHENSHQDISDQDTSQWQSEEVKDTMSATISVDSTALDNNSTPVSFNNLIEAQVSIDTGAVHWNGAHQAYGSLMDMELGKISPQEQITGCITPDLIFPAGSLSSAAPPTEDIGAKQGSDISEATSLPNIPSPAITIPSTLEKSASPVIPQAAAALVAVTPPKDIRRSTRARRQSSLAAQSEEYLQNAQGVSIVVPSAPAERVTRSKKVYCYCQKPDDGEVMIQCDNCRQWFHGACVDVTDEIAELMELKNEKFFCDPCTEKLKVRAKSQLGQKTSNLSNARDCALPTCLNEARATSDYCSEECAIKGIELEALQAVMNKDPRPAAIMIPPAKSSAQAAARKLSSPVQPLSPIQLKSPGSPKAEQNPVRSTALKGLTDSLMVAFENKPQQQEADLEKASRLAAVIEKELYMFTATPGQSGCGKDYKAKYRSLFFNLKDKNNESLRARVLSGELEPHELVRLTPEELANPELQSIAEEVRKRSIHDSVLTIEQEPFIKKTHKGDVSYIPGPSMMNESSSTSSTKPEDKDYDKEPNQDLTAEETPAEETVQAQQSSSKSTPVGSPTTDALDKLLARIQTNKRSGEEVLNDALTGEKRKKLSEGGPDGLAWVSSSSSYLPREPSPYSPSPSPSGSPALSSTTPPGSPPPLMLEGIERRLKSGASSASKQVLPVWQGTVYMHQVTKFFARAVQVGGSRVIPGRPSSDPLVEMIAPEWADILTKTVSIDGRIPTAAVASYVAQQRQSATKEVVVVQFELEDPSPASLEKRKAEFDKLFHYFYDKDRNGVVPNKGRHVKDMYLVPVASKDPLPVYLQNLMQVEALVRAREPRKDALFGVLIVNKASSHHHNRDHQHHHGQSPSHAKASSSHHRHSGASASRPYPTQHERRDSRESQSNGYTRRSSTVHSPSQQPPAVSSLFSIGTPMSAPASPSQNATSATPAITAPIKVPTLQELQGLVNQLFPAGNPGTPPVAISSPGSQTSQGLTPAAAAVTAQLSGTSASSLIAGLPANLAMNLGQTMAQFNQQQNVPVSHGQPYFARPPPPPLPAGMPIPPPGMPVPPPGFPPLPPHLLAQQQQGRPPMPIPPVPPMPPMAPHQLQAFLAQHQLQQQQGQQGQQGQPPQAMPPMSPFGPGFHPPPPRPNPQHVLQQQQQQQYQPYPPPSQGQWPEQTHHARPDQTRRRDWS